MTSIYSTLSERVWPVLSPGNRIYAVAPHAIQSSALLEKFSMSLETDGSIKFLYIAVSILAHTLGTVCTHEAPRKCVQLYTVLQAECALLVAREAWNQSVTHQSVIYFTFKISQDVTHARSIAQYLERRPTRCLNVTGVSHHSNLTEQFAKRFKRKQKVYYSVTATDQTKLLADFCGSCASIATAVRLHSKGLLTEQSRRSNPVFVCDSPLEFRTISTTTFLCSFSVR